MLLFFCFFLMLFFRGVCVCGFVFNATMFYDNQVIGILKRKLFVECVECVFK